MPTVVDDLLGDRDRIAYTTALAALASAQAHDRQAAALESIAEALVAVCRAAHRARSGP